MASMEDRIREYRSAASQKQAEKARAQAELDTAQGDWGAPGRL